MLTRGTLASAPDRGFQRDAIDDGLAGDAVANRLNAAREPAPHTDEQADPVDLLVTLVEEMLRD